MIDTTHPILDDACAFIAAVLLDALPEEKLAGLDAALKEGGGAVEAYLEANVPHAEQIAEDALAALK